MKTRLVKDKEGKRGSTRSYKGSENERGSGGLEGAKGDRPKYSNNSRRAKGKKKQRGNIEEKSESKEQNWNK